MRPPAGISRLPRGVWLIAGAVTLLLLAVAPRHGFHRDELYFLAAGQRPAFGYVDQPPLTPLLARAVDALPGEVTPLVLRVLPALAVAGLVLVAADLARRFGGGRFAVLFAGAAVGFGGAFLAAGHLFSTATFDLFFGGALLWLGVRLIDGADPRWWLAFGAVTGVGLLNKYTLAVIVGAFVLGIALSRQRRLLASPWPYAGAALALALVAPNLAWQAANGWPQLEMADALRSRSDGPAAFLLFQLIAVSVFAMIPASAGGLLLWRADHGRWRALPIGFLATFVIFLAASGKFYYVAAFYVPLLAAGGVWLETLRPAPRWVVAGLTGVGIVLAVPAALPVVPIEAAEPFNEVNGELGATVGWPQLVEQVRQAVDGLPAQDREGAAIFTANYGEAGAIERFGPDLPPVMSGHNNYWLWGPVPGYGPIIGVGPVADVLGSVCVGTVVQVGTIDNGFGITTEEQGTPILLCADPARSLGEVWDEVRHYN